MCGDVQKYEDLNEVDDSINVDIIKVTNKQYEDVTSIQIVSKFFTIYAILNKSKHCILFLSF